MVFGINYQKGIYFLYLFYTYSVQDQISGGCNGTVKETPKENSPVFKKCVYTLVGNNDQSLDVSAAKAKELGYNPVVLYSGLEGEATEMANKLINMAKDIRAGKGQVKAPAAIIAGINSFYSIIL